MATDGTLKLSRTQLAKIAQGDPEVIKQLENLFLQSAETNPESIASLQTQVDNLGLQALAPLLITIFNLVAGTNIAVTQTATNAFSIALAAVITGITSISASGAISAGSLSATGSNSGQLSNSSGNLMDSSVAITNGAAAAAGTLLNAPAAGNPTKWLKVVDNGVTRYVPAW